MTVSIRPNFHTELASSVIREIQYSQANYYYFLGKTETWNVGDIPPSGESLSSATDVSIRANSLFYKKIKSADVSLATTRYDWVSGTVYDFWDNTVPMQDKVFYVLADTNRVYKCLSNNGGVASTVSPAGTNYGVITTADGYVWKYMYSIPSFKVTKFVTPTHIPVQTALTDSFYNKGAIERIQISNGGAGYSDTIQTTITVTGAVSGSGATGTIVTDITGKIVAINLTSGGTNYTHGVKVNVNSSGGYGAILEPVIVDGVITDITIVDGGFLYATNDDLQFILAGAVLVPSINPTDGSITKVTIVDGGSGYSGSVTCTVNTTSTGAGAYGNPTALVTAIVYGGKVVQANIVDPGINYPYSSSTTINVVGDGSGASFYPTIKNGKIIDVVTASSGTGYTYAAITVVGTGTGAEFIPQMLLSDFTSDQLVVEQTSVDGAIYHINVTNGGTNYTASTTVTINGDGTGATAIATVVGGVITKITITNPGSGYTFASLVISDINRTLIGTVVDAVAYACLPPPNGHGTNAAKELFGNILVLNTQLRQDVSLNKLLQDYRQYGLIKDPTTLFTGKLFTSDSILATYICQFTSVVDLVVDEVLHIGNAHFRVIYINGLTVYLQSLGRKLIQPLGMLVAESNNSRTYTSFNISYSPAINKYSGQLLFVSDESPFSFTAEQGITLKTFLKF